MGFFSKIFKGIKKVVKKIGRGIKKVVKKVGRAVGKLGIVGQIGMMFLMPYAMSGLGSLFGQFAGGTANTWANVLMSKSNIAAKALGHTMNAIHTVGSAVIRPFTFVRDQIGEAINWIGDQTSTGSLTDGVNKLIGYDPETRLKEFDLEAIRGKRKADFGSLDISGIKEATAAADIGFTGRVWEEGRGSLMADATGQGKVDTGRTWQSESLLARPEVDVLDFSALPEDFSLTKATKVPKIEGINFGQSEIEFNFTPSFKEQVSNKFNDMANDIFNLKPAEKQGWFAKQGESVINAFRDFSVGEIVSSGIKRGGSERLAYAVAGERPQQNILQTVREQPNLFALSNMFSDSTIFRNVNLMSERQGNVWAGTNALNYDYVKGLGSDGTADYYNTMRSLELMN